MASVNRQPDIGIDWPKAPALVTCPSIRIAANCSRYSKNSHHIYRALATDGFDLFALILPSWLNGLLIDVEM
jgi:hypothetical protein